MQRPECGGLLALAHNDNSNRHPLCFGLYEGPPLIVVMLGATVALLGFVVLILLTISSLKAWPFSPLISRFEDPISICSISFLTEKVVSSKLCCKKKFYCSPTMGTKCSHNIMWSDWILIALDLNPNYGIGHSE